ncbi:MAG: glycosyltransferase [Cyanobacteria bacterium J06650_10]
MSQKKSYKLAFLNNLITPYRLPLYNGLSDKFDLHLLLSGKETNRETWQNLEELLENVKIYNVWGITLPFFEKRNGRAFDPRFLHLNPGYLWDLLKIRPDAVISSEMGFRSLIALFYGWLFKKPVWILWGGTLHTEKYRSRLKKLVRSIIFKKVTRWISYGKTTTDYLLDLGIARSHILQIQNCVDEKLYVHQHIELQKNSVPVLLYTGQFIKRKGISLFLMAVSQLQKEGYLFSTRLVGSGVEKENILKLISQLDLKQVSVLPSQHPSKMPEIYRSADILVFPTLEDVWGLVVNEALWSGLTVVSSIYAGCAEEILPVENLFDPCNQESFLHVLKKAITNKLAPPTTASLYKVGQVIDMISNDIICDLSMEEDQSLRRTAVNPCADGHTST